MYYHLEQEWPTRGPLEHFSDPRNSSHFYNVYTITYIFYNDESSEVQCIKKYIICVPIYSKFNFKNYEKKLTFILK